MNAAAIIKKEIGNQAARFVFPSETSSSAWARKACVFTGERSVAAGRFLAWDRFKETALRADLKNKKPVASIVRKLFAEKILGENAAEKFFRSLVPPEFAADGGVFAQQLAAYLPSLALWEERTSRVEGYVPDDEDRDFALLKKKYTTFLEEKNLFEPSWVKPPLRDRERVYYIFFPEAMEDFTEYAGLLSKEETIRLVHAEEETENRKLFLYDSSRAEIRAAVLEILRLHEEEGVPYEEIALSVPRLEDMEDCLLRELYLYNIPARRLSGKPLADYGAGNIFSLINVCASSGFTFSSLKAILLDDRLPWSDPGLNRELVAFGARNNCVSGYRDKGRPVDVWEEAFRSRPGGGGKIGQYYRDFKRHCVAITSARNFTDIRRRFYGLYPAFLSREKSDARGAAVLQRCMEELAGLIQIAEEYPELVPASPFAFYLSLLGEVNYVVAAQDCGVNVFPYRVAAAAPFAAHFVLNAEQTAATVLYQPLRFLRQDKRGHLGLADIDASRVFFSLYAQKDCAPFFRISAAEKTFTGWAIPHSFFSGEMEKSNPPADDPFLQEKLWWARTEASSFPPRLFPVQKRGFAAWASLFASGGGGEKLKLLKRPFTGGEVFAALGRRVREIQADGEALMVSATDMTRFFACPASWLFKKIFALEPFSLEAELLDDISLGILYHKILEKLFLRIREEDTVFRPANLEKYFDWAREAAGEAAEKNPAFAGPLAFPLVSAQADMLAWKLRGLLRMEAKELPEYAVSDCIEKKLSFGKGGALLVGKIDRVSVSPEGEPVIIDYKTGALPSAKECREEEGAPLEDFQAPMYVRLFEKEKEMTVKSAYFFSIHQCCKTDVFGKEKKDAGQTPRELYQPTLDAFDAYLDEFTRALRELDFSLKKNVLRACPACDYRAVCRSLYHLNSGGVHAV